ncbi:MAG: antibiotic biosynthesis monooxygenase family protein [Sphingobacterium sp.]
MILEVAILHVRNNLIDEFENSFLIAQKIISKKKGYLSHELKKCLEDPSKYILLVNWETLEDHTIGFRESKEYQEWKELLHHFYDPFPTVEHYR